MAGDKKKDLTRRVKMMAIASLNDADCPSTDDLAGYILGLLPSPRKEEVAAHVASCVLCQEIVGRSTPPPDAP
jgi:hypothetical protein